MKLYATLGILAFLSSCSPIATESLDLHKAEHSVVMLEVEKYGSGAGATGVVIGKNLILTARHVVEDTPDEPLYVTDFDGNHFEAKTVWQSDKSDIALLSAEIPAVDVPEPIAGNLPEAGEPIVMLGHPMLQVRWNFAWGHVTSDVAHPVEGVGDLLPAELAGTKGDSGAPIFDSHNHVVAVLSMGITIASGGPFSGGRSQFGVVLLTPLANDYDALQAAIKKFELHGA